MTGTVQTPNPSLFPQKERDSLVLSLLNGVNGAIKPGTEVRISANNTVNTRTGAQFPIGVVEVGGTVQNELISVRTVFQMTMKAIAKGGTLSAGAFLKPNGSFNANGLPEYVAVAASDYATAICIQGGAADAEIVLGILRSPIQLPA